MNKSNTSFNFDPIAGRYDLCNHLFSLGLDRRWRRVVVRTLGPQAYHRVLDLCCGTGDLVFAFAKYSSAPSITGLDISEAMIRRARQKQNSAWNDRIHWHVADAADTGLADASFDVVTCAFGLRNIPDRLGALREMRRLLRPGGQAAILDFSLPKSRLLRVPYWLYLRYFMPAAGALLFGNSSPLRYLAESVREWDETFDLAQAAAAGLECETQKPLTCGIVTLTILRRPQQHR